MDRQAAVGQVPVLHSALQSVHLPKVSSLVHSVYIQRNYSLYQWHSRPLTIMRGSILIEGDIAKCTLVENGMHDGNVEIVAIDDRIMRHIILYTLYYLLKNSAANCY